MTWSSMAIRRSLLAIFCFAASSQSILMASVILSQSADYDAATDIVSFQIEFDTTPDFYSVDSAGRPADSFQYYVFYDSNAHQSDLFADLVIRGDEIHLNGGEIAIRDAMPYGTGGPNSGGWGPLRGDVSFDMSGNTLTFAAPLSVIGDPNGIFGYRLESFHYGFPVGQIEFGGPGLPTPEPSTLALLSCGAVGIGIVGRRRSNQPHTA